MALVHSAKANFNCSGFFEVTISKTFCICALLRVAVCLGFSGILDPQYRLITSVLGWTAYLICRTVYFQGFNEGKKDLKILFINNDKGWGGGQEHLKDLVIELLHNGVEVHFVVRFGSKSSTRFRELGVSVHQLPGHGLKDLLALQQLVVLLRRERFDIVSINREHDLLLTALAWKIAFPCRKSGRLMMSYHTATTRKQLLLGSVDAIICVSEHVRSRLLQANPGFTGKVSVLYNGIAIGGPPSVDKFNFDRHRRFFQKDGFPLIGMVGDFFKNQGEFVDMIPQLKQSFPALKVVFVGDNSDRALLDPLLAKIDMLGVENDVIFTGKVPREKIPDLFYDLDLSVTTYRNEGFGVVHLESLAAGTPVVAYNEGGFVDIFKGTHAGVLVDGRSDDFIAAVIDLLNDHENRFSMGVDGYELVKMKYSVQGMGQNYLAFYRKLSGTL
ncbi:MAG: glycosyltransferase family 1 protein [Geobacter sp.]|nr:MAG: glycosyltransferase family 1 protein [Geobacter sp.]